MRRRARASPPRRCGRAVRWWSPSRPPTGLVPAHKGAHWMRLTARGRAAHGSAPELGDNAAVRLARAAVALHDFDDWPHAGRVRLGHRQRRGAARRRAAQRRTRCGRAAPRRPHRAVGIRRHGPRPGRSLAGDGVGVEDHVVLPPLDTPSDDFVGLVAEALAAAGLDGAAGRAGPLLHGRVRAGPAAHPAGARRRCRRWSSARGSRTSATSPTSGARWRGWTRRSRSTPSCSAGGAPARSPPGEPRPGMRGAGPVVGPPRCHLHRHRHRRDARRVSALVGLLFGLAGMGSSSAAIALPVLAGDLERQHRRERVGDQPVRADARRGHRGLRPGLRPGGHPHSRCWSASA